MDHTSVRGVVIGEYLVCGDDDGMAVQLYNCAGDCVLTFGIAQLDEVETHSAPRPPAYWWEPQSRLEKAADGIEYCLCPMQGRDGNLLPGRSYMYSAAYKGYAMYVLRYGTQRTISTLPGYISPDVEDGAQVLSEDIARTLAKALLKHACGEQRLPVDMDRERRQAASIQQELENDDQERNRRMVMSGERDLADYVWRAVHLDDGTMIMDQLGIKPGFGHPAYPNANEGMHLRASLPSLLEKDFAKLGKAGTVVVRQEFKKKELVSYTVRSGKHRVHVFIGYTYNRDQATRLMCQFRSYSDASGRHYFTQGVYFGNGSGDSGRPFTPEELADGTESAGDAVGEFAIRMRHAISDEGLPVKGSEKRSIYFTRGNTAVALFTDEPDINVLPLARAIDKLLVEGMRKAGEPLTREQDYLKEEKKQK